MTDEEAFGALRAEFARDAGLARVKADEIWVRSRVDEILEAGRPRPALRALGFLQLLTLDTAAAALSWSLLGEAPAVPLWGLALSKLLVVALVTATAHTAATLSRALATARL